MRRDIECPKCGENDWATRLFNSSRFYCRKCNSDRRAKWAKENCDKVIQYPSNKKEFQKNWRLNNITKQRVYSYRRWDKEHGFSDTISMEFADQLMTKHCVWCHRYPALGLDRNDNSKGHTVGNVVACCEKCNFILGDIPFSAKIKLRDGLCEIETEGLLDSWIPPTKRKK